MRFFYFLVGAAWTLWYLNSFSHESALTVAALYLVVASSGFCFIVFAYDKFCAAFNHPRIPESFLLALTFFGGFTGALFSQSLFNHKISKRSFQVPFFLATMSSAVMLFFLSSYL